MKLLSGKSFDRLEHILDNYMSSGLLLLLLAIAVIWIVYNSLNEKTNASLNNISKSTPFIPNIPSNTEASISRSITEKPQTPLNNISTPIISNNLKTSISPETEVYLRARKYTTLFCVAGVQYYDYYIAARKRLFRDATTITLKRQLKSRKDTNAIEVYFADVKVGYVPSYETAKLTPQFNQGDTFTAYLEYYNSRG